MVKRVKWIRCESNGQLETAAERPAGKKKKQERMEERTTGFLGFCNWVVKPLLTGNVSGAAAPVVRATSTEPGSA